MNTRTVISLKNNNDDYYIYMNCVDYSSNELISLQYCKSTRKCRIKLKDEWKNINGFSLINPSPIGIFDIGSRYINFIQPIITTELIWEEEND